MNISTQKQQQVQSLYDNFKWTPTLAHWNQIKQDSVQKYGENTIIFFQVGTFYECYFLDAYIASEIIGQTLTSKDKSNPDAAPMSGSPILVGVERAKKLVAKGYTVVMVQETGLPSTSDFKRVITNVFTPGTNFENVGEKTSTFILSVFSNKYEIGIILSDVASNQFWCDTQTLNSEIQVKQYIDGIVSLWKPVEIIGNEASQQYVNCTKHQVTEGFVLPESLKSFETYYQQNDQYSLLNCLKQTVHYISQVHDTDCEYIVNIQPLLQSDSFLLDNTTVSNLELFESNNHDEITFFNTINHTSTSFGSRELEHHIRTPLKDITKINSRLSGISELLEKPNLHLELISLLQQFSDIERLATKLIKPLCTPNDILDLAQSLSLIPSVKKLLESSENQYLKNINSNLSDFTNIVQGIKKTLRPTGGISSKEGEIINRGVNPTLDELLDLTSDRDKWYLSYQQKLMEEHKIVCKVGENNTGVFIETKDNIVVPKEWDRVKSLKSGTRYVTTELQEYWKKTFDAVIKRNQLELKIFTSLRTRLSHYMQQIQKNSQGLALLDVICSHTTLARTNNYKKPELSLTREIKLVNSRHPVIETLTDFKSNNVDISDKYIQIVTGPNMGGKSTYIRQIALNVLLSQIGSYAAIDSGVVGICDGIFTRVGASDNISRGHSTFYVEMLEVSHILHSCTKDSLVILDEVGRGTSTVDGEAISESVCEYLGQKQTRTIFATHYHTLGSLQQNYIESLHVGACVNQDNILEFDHSVRKGVSNKSWGIEIGHLAGLPKQVIDRAYELLNQTI